jgi:UDP-N-acetylmuramoyl-L-alanyl-D-glutamate--2,6-diaminopimelate ligase
VRAAGGTAGVLGTVSYRIGGRALPSMHTTPEADVLYDALARMVESGCSHALLEVSSHALALQRVHGVRFAAGVFTNLTRDHLDFHGTMERYFEAKSVLFRSLPASSVAVLNADSDVSSRLASLTPARIVTFGASPRADFRIGEVQSSFAGVRLELSHPGSPRSLDVISPSAWQRVEHRRRDRDSPVARPSGRGGAAGVRVAAARRPVRDDRAGTGLPRHRRLRPHR